MNIENENPENENANPEINSTENQTVEATAEPLHSDSESETEKPETEITEEDFSYYILDNVLYRQCGQGSHSLNIANIEVNKLVCPYKSNSGKSSDSDVTISWIGSDGKPHILNKPSIYRGNRRSAPNRNWGLGRE